jgi:hypothetical protein
MSTSDGTAFGKAHAAHDTDSVFDFLGENSRDFRQRSQ